MLKISNDMYWTGYIDWDLKVFHGYKTPYGSTYNAYLIDDEYPTLIDTVKHYGQEDMLRQIKEVMNPANIRYVIANHAEMDHSGAIDAVLQLAPEAEVVCSARGAEALTRHFKKNWRFKIVKTGDRLSIGRREFMFIQIPMVHWPESMATYSVTDHILFSNDAFGQHYASEERFVDELPLDRILGEAAKYYANIVLLYGAQVQKALQSLKGFTIEMICPSHGLIWRDKPQIAHILNSYDKWASHETDPQRVLIVYDTMWKSTEAMALRFKTLFEGNGYQVMVRNLQDYHISDVMTDVLLSRLMLVGTPMLNNRMLPTVASFLMYLKGLQPKNRLALTFGSYGWSKAGFKEVEQSVTDAGLTLGAEGQYIQFVPGENDLRNLNRVVDQLKAQMLSV
ncbi:MAG TPA: flavodoxin domain-containing protein [Candidatus Omnitrophota bacterium]|nr:flavodoxin domain-containing protein [Candidatus Omnitrophota bacterium]HQO58511.1 flavodoxin domain-containing protein [Candidatus Omnitrophota bacterium]